MRSPRSLTLLAMTPVYMNDEEKKDEQEYSDDSASHVQPADEQDTLKKERDEYLAGWKRALADYDNLRKFQSKEREEWMKTITAEVVVAFLPLYDYLQAAVAVPPQMEGVERWVDGIRHIGQQFLSIIGQFGVTKMEVVDQKFDSALHETVGTESNPSKEEDVILKEMQAGFMLNGKVVRPAKVIINQHL